MAFLRPVLLVLSQEIDPQADIYTDEVLILSPVILRSVLQAEEIIVRPDQKYTAAKFDLSIELCPDRESVMRSIGYTDIVACAAVYLKSRKGTRRYARSEGKVWRIDHCQLDE